MDLLRSCYETDFCFFADDFSIITRVRWFFTDPGAEVLPYRHRFGSLNWERPVGDLSPGLGEVPGASRPWRNGVNFTGHDGSGNAIPPAKWVNGCSLGEVVLPGSCSPGFWYWVRFGPSVSFGSPVSLRSRPPFGPRLVGRLVFAPRVLRARPPFGPRMVGLVGGPEVMPGLAVWGPSGAGGLGGLPGVACFCVSLSGTFSDSFVASLVGSGPGVVSAAFEQGEQFVFAGTGTAGFVSAAVVQTEQFAMSGTGTAGTVAAVYTDVGGVAHSFAFAGTGTAGVVSAAVVQTEQFAMSGTGTAGTVAAAYREIVTTSACTTCNPAPLSWRFTVAGIANGTCVSCASYNGTRTLTWSTGCFWLDSLNAPCGMAGSSKAWRLKYDSPTSTWFLEALLLSGVGQAARYTLANSSWNCLGTNVMTLALSSGACSGWPSTVTISPV